MGADAFQRLNEQVLSDRELSSLTYDEITKILRSVYEPELNKWSSRSQLGDVK